MAKLSDESVVWEFVVPAAIGEMKSVLYWDSEDPFALHVTFLDASGPVPWVFERDLVNEAMITGSAGDADVKLAVENNVLTMTLSSSQTIIMKTPLLPVETFVTRTFSYIPAGEEKIELDETIRRLLEDV